MKINLISSDQDFRSLESDWTDLFKKGEHTIFQSFEFNYYSWISDIGKKKENILCVVLIYGRDLEAIIPFYMDSYKRLRFINDTHADFCDYISNKFLDLADIYRFLRKKISFRFIQLNNMRAAARMYKSAMELDVGYKFVVSDIEYSELDIDRGVFPYNVLHYRSRHKHRINKVIKKHRDKRSIFIDNKTGLFPKKEILYLRESMVQSGGRDYSFLTDERLILIEHLFHSDLIVLHMLVKKDKVYACNILTRDSSCSFMTWIDLFDSTQMINIASYIYFLKFISLGSSIRMSFGRGNYRYKSLNFAPKFYRLSNIHIFSNKYQEIIFRIFYQIRYFLNSIYKNIKQ